MYGRKTKFGKQPRTHKCGFPTSRVLVIPLISRYGILAKSQKTCQVLLKIFNTF